MEKQELKQIIECLLFVASKPIALNKFASILDDVTPKEVEQAIGDLTLEYDESNRPVFIQKVAGGWRMATRQHYARWIKALFAKEITYKLSNAALEVLAIIAYRQPVTVGEIEIIRGVSSGGVIRNLLEKGLIKIAGRKEVIGRPILYRTTDKFLEYFGLDSISDIPPLEELGIDSDLEMILEKKHDNDEAIEEEIASDQEASEESQTIANETSEEETNTSEEEVELKENEGEEIDDGGDKS